MLAHFSIETINSNKKYLFFFWTANTKRSTNVIFPRLEFFVSSNKLEKRILRWENGFLSLDSCFVHWSMWVENPEGRVFDVSVIFWGFNEGTEIWIVNYFSLEGPTANIHSLHSRAYLFLVWSPLFLDWKWCKWFLGETNKQTKKW